MRKLTTDFVNVILPIVAYFILVYLGSLGLLQVEQINQLTNPLGDYAQILAVTVMILLSYVAGSIFITPMKLYYEQKKEADRHNWNNVYFGEILPAHRNLLGLALVITNEKMTPIENLSVWLVGISPSSTGNVAKGKRIGYVEHYETDKEPIFSDVNFLDTDREAVFPFSNYDEQDRFVLTLQSGARNTSPIELIKNGGLTGAYVLDFEFRAKGFEPKIIRYTLINNEDGLTFDKYEIKGHKKFKK